MQTALLSVSERSLVRAYNVVAYRADDYDLRFLFLYNVDVVDYSRVGADVKPLNDGIGRTGTVGSEIKDRHMREDEYLVARLGVVGDTVIYVVVHSCVRGAHLDPLKQRNVTGFGLHFQHSRGKSPPGVGAYYLSAEAVRGLEDHKHSKKQRRYLTLTEGEH